MQPLRQGGLCARLARAEEREALARLRSAAFPRKSGGAFDRYDDAAWQIVVDCEEGGQLLAAYRLGVFASGAALSESYSAQFYDLAPLAAYPKPVLEIGRFCLADHPAGFQALRLGWGALARIVDDLGAGLMIGCSSFKGADPERHHAALALLASGHIGPKPLLPRPKSPLRLDLPTAEFDRKSALLALPSVLRSYLSMGGWVSDHAVIDPDLDTLHVFTCVEVANIPRERARSLRQIAGS